MNKVKKVDVHCHVTMNLEKFTNRFHDNTPILTKDEMRAIHEKLNVEMGVVSPLLSNEFVGSRATTDDAFNVAQSDPAHFSWFCCIDPRNYEPDAIYGVLAKYKEMGAKGLSEFTPNLYFDDPLIDRVFSCCEELALPVLIHISPALGHNYGLVDEIHLPRFEKMLKKHKNLTFIGHSQPYWAEMGDEITPETRNDYPKGKVNEGRIPKLMREYGNLYSDISAGSGSNALRRDPEYAAKFVEEFSDRIMYGCDICSRNDTFMYTFDEFLTKMLEDGMFSEENYAKIVRYNAVKLLGLDLE